MLPAIVLLKRILSAFTAVAFIVVVCDTEFAPECRVWLQLVVLVAWLMRDACEHRSARCVRALQCVPVHTGATLLFCQSGLHQLVGVIELMMCADVPVECLAYLCMPTHCGSCQYLAG